MKTITLKEWKNMLDSIGYEYDKTPMTLEKNKAWCMPILREKDTKTSWAHYKNARRDDNYKKLKEWLFSGEIRVIHRNYECMI